MSKDVLWARCLLSLNCKEAVPLKCRNCVRESTLKEVWDWLAQKVEKGAKLEGVPEDFTRRVDIAVGEFHKLKVGEFPSLKNEEENGTEY